LQRDDERRQISCLLFLKHLDDLEREWAVEYELLGKPYTFIINDAHR